MLWPVLGFTFLVVVARAVEVSQGAFFTRNSVVDALPRQFPTSIIVVCAGFNVLVEAQGCNCGQTSVWQLLRVFLGRTFCCVHVRSRVCTSALLSNSCVLLSPARAARGEEMTVEAL